MTFVAISRIFAETMPSSPTSVRGLDGAGGPYGLRDVRSLYPTVSENHLRYLEKWGLLRQSGRPRAEREYSFTDLLAIKQVASELEKGTPLKGGSISDALLMTEHPSVWTRCLAVGVAALSQVPWIVLVAWGFSVADEYERHIGLVATAIAFVGYVLLYVTFAVIQNAHLVDEHFYLPYVPVAGLMWLTGLGLAKLYYRLRP